MARVRKRYVAAGLEAALHRKPPAREYRRKLDGEQEAHLVALACSAPPEGRKRWTLRLLADRLVELEVVEAVSHETVRQALKQNELKPWLKEQWCIPPEQRRRVRLARWRTCSTSTPGPTTRAARRSAWTRPAANCSPRSPRRCRSRPGQPAREDYEYVRQGVCNLFLVCEPLRGWRHVTVSDRRTRVDWAHCIQDLVDVHYPDAEQIVLVQDNLNTHTPASLYEAFPPAEAKRLADKLELHYTPKHGSWLNMAEIELSVLAGQCLDRRLPDRATLEREVAAWAGGAQRAPAAASTGASPPPTPASSSSTSTPQFRTDELLGGVCSRQEATTDAGRDDSRPAPARSSTV